MRLKEEKQLMTNYIISGLILIVIVFIQITDNKINNFDNNLEEIKFAVLESMFNRNYHLAAHNSYTETANLLDISNASVVKGSIKPFDLTNIKNIDTNNLRHLKRWNKVANGELSLSQFYHQEAKYYSDLHRSESINYENKKTNYLKNKQNGTYWTYVKIIFVILEVILIMINLYIYFILHKNINSRLKS